MSLCLSDQPHLTQMRAILESTQSFDKSRPMATTFYSWFMHAVPQLVHGFMVRV
jgi:hypothetical protein